jgi:hypothetical protein
MKVGHFTFHVFGALFQSTSSLSWMKVFGDELALDSLAISIHIQLLSWMKGFTHWTCSFDCCSFNPHPAVKLDESHEIIGHLYRTSFNPHPAVRLDESSACCCSLQCQRCFNPHPTMKLDEKG